MRTGRGWPRAIGEPSIFQLKEGRPHFNLDERKRKHFCLFYDICFENSISKAFVNIFSKTNRCSSHNYEFRFVWSQIMASEAKDENPEHINLKVMGQDGNIVQFKIKRHR